MAKTHRSALGKDNMESAKNCARFEDKAKLYANRKFWKNRLLTLDNLCLNRPLRLQRMQLFVSGFDCHHSNQPQVRGLNSGTAIKNQGWQLLALELSATANPGNVNPYISGGKKSGNFHIYTLETATPI